MLDSLEKKFSKPVAPVAPPVDEPTGQCPRCSGSKFWRPSSGGEWRCDRCQPAPSEALVGERSNLASEEVEPVRHVMILMAGAPVCGSCGCHTLVETWVGDNSADIACECCGGAITGEIIESMRPVAKERGFCV